MFKIPISPKSPDFGASLKEIIFTAQSQETLYSRELLIIKTEEIMAYYIWMPNYIVALLPFYSI